MLEMTFGYELEIGDVPKSTEIPTELGTWEYAETDIVNMYGEYRGTAVDPLGISPPMGGEINIKPSKNIEEVVEKVSTILRMFRKEGYEPSASCVNHGHVHVRVVGLRNDIELLKRLTKRIKKDQKKIVGVLYNYVEQPDMKGSKTARTYLKWDGGRMMPDWMCDNIIEKANTFEDFIRLQCCGKDAVSMGRPFRYAINTYCMKHTDTIEFRCFRASLNMVEVYDSIRFAKDFLELALYGKEETTIEELLDRGNYSFPKLNYEHDLYLGWENTKWSKERGKKQRKLYEI